MNVGLYTSVTGKQVMSKNLEIISRNLANANTNGFKKNMPIFRVFLEEENSMYGVTMPKLAIDHNQGSIKETANKLDFAIHGNGYFVLNDGQGIKYSRNGHFLLNSDMEIANDLGWKLQGRNGVIRLPRNAKDILINSEGSVIVDGVSISKIDIVDFNDKDVLKEAGNSSFSLKSEDLIDNIVENPANYEIQQGYLETSNVNVIDEMVNLISNMRSFEGNNNVNKTVDRTLERLLRTAYTTI